MKYIKKYEMDLYDLKDLKEGDYVLVRIDFSKIDATPVQLVSVRANEDSLCKMIDDKNKIIHLQRRHIIRKLKPKEIEEFELEYNMNKYNL